MAVCLSAGFVGSVGGRDFNDGRGCRFGFSVSCASVGVEWRIGVRVQFLFHGFRLSVGGG